MPLNNSTLTMDLVKGSTDWKTF